MHRPPPLLQTTLLTQQFEHQSQVQYIAQAHWIFDERLIFFLKQTTQSHIPTPTFVRLKRKMKRAFSSHRDGAYKSVASWCSYHPIVFDREKTAVPHEAVQSEGGSRPPLYPTTTTAQYPSQAVFQGRPFFQGQHQQCFFPQSTSSWTAEPTFYPTMSPNSQLHFGSSSPRYYTMSPNSQLHFVVVSNSSLSKTPRMLNPPPSPNDFKNFVM